jgi:hypothetical protein
MFATKRVRFRQRQNDLHDRPAVGMNVLGWWLKDGDHRSDGDLCFAGWRSGDISGYLSKQRG